MNHLNECLKSFFSPSIKCELASHDDWENPLSPDEQTTIAKAVPSRKREFSAGRAVAKRLLQSMGVDCNSINVNLDRTPQWPIHWIGSISHCKNTCWVAVSPDRHCWGIGIDVEQYQALDTAVCDIVLTHSEQQDIDKSTNPELSSLIFSCKESLHKAIYPNTGIRLDFKDAQITLTEKGYFTALIQHAALPQSPLKGRYLIDQGLVYTGIELTR